MPQPLYFGFAGETDCLIYCLLCIAAGDKVEHGEKGDEFLEALRCKILTARLIIVHGRLSLTIRSAEDCKVFFVLFFPAPMN